VTAIKEWKLDEDKPQDEAVKLAALVLLYTGELSDHLPALYGDDALEDMKGLAQAIYDAWKGERL